METVPARTGASSAEMRAWAFVASLVGGVLVAAGGLVMGFMMLMMGGMMGMTMMGGAPMLSAAMPLWGLVTGLVMVIGAFRVRASERDAMPWGVAILVASALSLLAVGGFLIGAVLGVVGGGVAVASARHA